MEYAVIAERGDIIGIDDPSFASADLCAREGAAFLGPCIVWEYSSTQEQEIICIWSRHADH